MLDFVAPLVIDNTTKIVLLSLDGLGGLARPETGRSELETARIPNLSALATDGVCGLLRHVAPGITPGSGPGHLGLFGYDPMVFQVGRGVLEARGRIADEPAANMVLLRGFDLLPDMPRFPEVFRLRAAAIAAYPMYRGLARLVGMDVLKTGGTFKDELATLREHWDAYDFFFVHYKDTDKAGEDGDFEGKVQALERLDRAIPDIRALGPDVLIVS